MARMLTTKDVQALIRVDRSTIYRMAEAGRIPAIKVGRQWRFPEEHLAEWLGEHRSPLHDEAAAAPRRPGDALGNVLPPRTVQALAELLGEVFGIMVIITDIEGRPLTRVANPCGLFRAIEDAPGTVEKCIEGWKELGDEVDMTPRFVPSHIGFLCARGFVRVGSALQGMVIVGGVAPEAWPPAGEQIEALAAELGMSPDDIAGHIDEVYRLDRDQMDRVLSLLPGVGTLISHLASERGQLVTRLEAIASLAGPA